MHLITQRKRILHCGQLSKDQAAVQLNLTGAEQTTDTQRQRTNAALFCGAEQNEFIADGRAEITRHGFADDYLVFGYR